MSLNSHLEVLTFNTKLIENNSGVRRMHGWTIFDLNDAMAHYTHTHERKNPEEFIFIWFSFLFFSRFILLSSHAIRHTTFDVYVLTWDLTFTAQRTPNTISFLFLAGKS